MVFIKRLILLICILIFGITSIISIANAKITNDYKEGIVKEKDVKNEISLLNKSEEKSNLDKEELEEVNVKIKDCNGQKFTEKSIKAACGMTVKEVLKNEGIVIGNKDITVPAHDVKIESSTRVINIIRGKGAEVKKMENKTDINEKIKTDRYDAINNDERDIPKKRKVSSPDSKKINGYSYKKKLRGSTTAYTARSGARTSTGRKATFGVVAVNPKIIPYGTKLYIPGYGTAIAGDTGGALMKGTALVDVFYPTYKQCCQWGRRNLDIYILK